MQDFFGISIILASLPMIDNILYYGVGSSPTSALGIRDKGSIHQANDGLTKSLPLGLEG